ncbi:MAG: hypothetical protein ACHP8B_06435 [Terriglobales bacterium]
MKNLLLIVFAVASAAPLYAQESVMIKEPAGQCYLDLKSTLREAIRWDDEQMMVTSRPLLTTAAGNIDVVVRIFPEHGVDKKTNERVEMCKLLVAINAPDERSNTLNAVNTSWLFRNASLMKARIESVMKARKKKSD